MKWDFEKNEDDIPWLVRLIIVLAAIPVLYFFIIVFLSFGEY